MKMPDNSALIQIYDKYFAQGEKPNIAQAHGVLVFNKPSGPTSARCISFLKRLGQKKIGHAGTLDPMAEGVLLVLLGHATKISGHLMSDGKKVYKGCLRLGQQTDTWDAEGQVVTESAWQHIDADSVREAMLAWQGSHEQEVPPFSAAKHEGKALYKLARAGLDTPKKVKFIEISRVEVLEINPPFASFRVECSSGTYIRSLAHSLGMRLGCGAVLTELTREYSHPFGLDVAQSFEAICAKPNCLQDLVMPITSALPHWPVVKLTAAEEAEVMQGTPLTYRKACVQQEATHNTHSEEKAILLSQDGKALALAKAEFFRDKLCWTILRGLW